MIAACGFDFGCVACCLFAVLKKLRRLTGRDQPKHDEQHPYTVRGQHIMVSIVDSVQNGITILGTGPEHSIASTSGG